MCVSCAYNGANTSRAIAICSACPPAIIANVPCCAPATPPETGASTQPIPYSANNAASSRVISGRILDKSMTNLLAVADGAICSRTTCSTTEVSARHNKMTSAACNTSAIVGDAIAPASITVVNFSTLRFQTLTLKPASNKRNVNGCPIKPIPIKPRVCFCFDMMINFRGVDKRLFTCSPMLIVIRFRQ